LYNWNVSLGADFGDHFSVDFRLSNESGYACDNLAFENGSAKGFLPYLPNAYFTWRPGNVFSLSGGLLEVSDNTVLNLVAGYETGSGLYTSYANWATLYNNSQGGLKFGFDISDNFSLNLTTALVSPTNTLDEDPSYNEFRFILDAGIGLGDVVTLSPVFNARSYWHSYIKGGDEKSSVLFAYGLDANFDFSESVTLGVGIAAGNIKGKNLVVDDWRGNTENESMFGILIGAYPELAFGINEVGLGYSLGLATDKDAAGNKRFTNAYHDTYATWHFRVNDYLALGPSAFVALETSKNDGSDDKSGMIWQRFGLDIAVSF